MRKTSDHAIVSGASLAGLLTARVLAEVYKQVTVVERDELPPVGQQRKGVPHGRHLHGLHPRGREILDELLPDFTAELTAAGAVCCDVLADARWQLSGHQLKQRHAGLPALLASRPFLEGHVREHVFGLPNVRVLDGHSVAGLMAARGGRRVTGTRVSDAEGKPEVIDAAASADPGRRGRAERPLPRVPTAGTTLRSAKILNVFLETYRQPSPGATWVRMLSMTWAL
jgi:2-polyprenyl-6-methoxyphenol hydroxylase-like FAD-dependent oxidoreductase